MSYREVRSFCEIMRTLGYPRIISMENFREPNFPLVADCLEWLVRRYDQGVVIAADIDTASDRVLFLQTIDRTMFAKARIKLNLRKLYTADGHAVRELLKVARLLFDANRSADTADPAGDVDGGVVSSALPADAAQMRTVRELAAEVQAVGNLLQEALLREGEMSRARARAFATDTQVVQDQLREAVQGVRGSAHNMEAQADQMDKERRALEGKMRKRADELERQRQRLVAVQGVRPAYMAEYERLMEQLQALFAEYLERHRNLEYLQRRLESLEAKEQREAEEDERRMRKAQAKMQREMEGVLGGNHEVDDSGLDSMESGDIEFSNDGDSDGRGAGRDTLKRPTQPDRGARRQATGGAPPPGAGGGRQVGNLSPGAAADDDDSLSGSGLSDDDGSASGGVSFGSEVEATGMGKDRLRANAGGLLGMDEDGDLLGGDGDAGIYEDTESSGDF